MVSRPYTSARRAAAAAETRQAILDAALALFQELGFRRTTISEVAHRAGVAVNTVYSSVGGKPNLLIALIAGGASDEAIDDVLEEAGRSQRGEDIIGILVRGTGSVSQRHEWLLRELYENAGSDESIRAAVVDAEARYFERLASAARRLETLHELRREIDAIAAADILWYFLGHRSWLILRARGWDWADAEQWLLVQCRGALLG